MELKQKHHAQQKAAAGKPNLTGIPLQMKQSFERSSGLSFDDVRVHYHSSLPARLGALAYTRGSHVYVSSGQERHLGHELGHVIQQKQGQVRATSELNGVRLNTSPVMEREADALSRQAARGEAIQMRQGPASEVVQMVQYPDIGAMWQGLCKGVDVTEMIQTAIEQDPVLDELYNDAARQVSKCDFQPTKDGTLAHVTLNSPASSPPYVILHKEWSNEPIQQQRTFVRAIIHELTHVAAREQYQRNIPDPAVYKGNTLIGGAWLNMNLPPPQTPGSVSKEQNRSIQKQYNQLLLNIRYLHSVVKRGKGLPKHAKKYLVKRLNYMEHDAPHHHYDTVLGDMMFYLQFKGLQGTPSYGMMQRMLREANDRRHQRRGADNESPYPIREWSFWHWSTWNQRY